MVAMESDSSIEKRSVDETAKPHLATHDVDVAAELTAGKDFVLDPAEAARVRYVTLCARCARGNVLINAQEKD